MKKVTRWSPDTCGCVVDYEWNDKQPGNIRDHTLKTIVQFCPAHQGLSDAEVFLAVFDENKRKNKTLKKAGELKGAEIEPDAISWSFDQNRRLDINLPVLNSSQRAALQAWCNNSLGANKVKVN